MAEGIHSGHRDRVRKEFLKNGFDENTPPHKILEMLLFYSIPRKDTNDIAHALINHFGSIAGVIDAPVSELVKVNGVSMNTASLIKLILPIAKQYSIDKASSYKGYDSIDNIGDYILDRYIGFTKEVFSVTSFNSNGKIIGFDIISEGDVTSATVSNRDVLETALKRQAVSVIIAHNHPGGVAVPTKQDIVTTLNLKDAIKHINVRLADHIILADDDYISMAISSKYRHIF